MNKPIANETPALAPSTVAASTQEEPNFAAILARMTPAERLRAYRSGAFTRREVSIWTARFPRRSRSSTVSSSG